MWGDDQVNLAQTSSEFVLQDEFRVERPFSQTSKCKKSIHNPKRVDDVCRAMRGTELQDLARSRSPSVAPPSQRHGSLRHRMYLSMAGTRTLGLGLGSVSEICEVRMACFYFSYMMLQRALLPTRLGFSLGGSHLTCVQDELGLG